MKKNSQIIELAFTIVIAFLLSGVMYMVLAFVLDNLNIFTRGVADMLNTFTSACAGVIVGYKLHILMMTSLVRTRKSIKKKISSRT
jgi:uncharacterized metal-binding protein